MQLVTPGDERVDNESPISRQRQLVMAREELFSALKPGWWLGLIAVLWVRGPITPQRTPSGRPSNGIGSDHRAWLRLCHVFGEWRQFAHII